MSRDTARLAAEKADRALELHRKGLSRAAIAVVRQHGAFADAFRTIKDILGLSDAFCDEIGGLTVGHTSKCLGPTGIRGIGPVPFDTFCALFAVEFHMVVNLDAAKVMQDKWERRNSDRVHVMKRKVSKQILERATPLVLKEIGRKGGLKSASLPTAQQARSKGGKMRKRKLSKARRREIATKAANARYAKRAAITTGTLPG
jgi:hypothetical protein